MIIIGILLSIAGLGFFCWLLFMLAVYALPFFAAVSAGMFVYDSGAGPVGIIAAGALTGILTACRRTGDFRCRALAVNPHIDCSVVRGAGCIRWLSRDPWHRRADHAVRDLAADLRRDWFDCRWLDRLDADGNADARSA